MTANSIFSLVKSAGSACASEVEAVPSGVIVGPNRHLEKGESREFSHAASREEVFQGRTVGRNAGHC